MPLGLDVGSIIRSKQLAAVLLTIIFVAIPMAILSDMFSWNTWLFWPFWSWVDSWRVRTKLEWSCGIMVFLAWLTMFAIRRYRENRGWGG